MFCLVDLLQYKAEYPPNYDTHGVVHTDIQEGIPILNTPYDRSDAFDDDDE